MPRTTAMTLAVSVFVLAAAMEAQAQVRVATGGGRAWYANPYRYGGGYGGYGNYGGGTAAGNYMQGMSSVIRASGEAEQGYASARIMNEEARSAYIDNTKKWTQTYYEKQSMWRANEDRKAQNERASRDKWLENKPSDVPPRLSASQVDLSTGQVQWPLALQGEIFAKDRAHVEDLILQRRFSSPPDLVEDLNRTAKRMHADLKMQINDMQPNDYIAAMKFLNSLALEGHYLGQ